MSRCHYFSICIFKVNYTSSLPLKIFFLFWIKDFRAFKLHMSLKKKIRISFHDLQVQELDWRLEKPGMY